MPEIYVFIISVSISVEVSPPDNGSAGFFCRMNCEVFVVIGWFVESVVMRTLPVVQLILRGTVCQGCGNGNFFSFLFLLRNFSGWRLLWMLFPGWRFDRFRLEQFFQRLGAAPCLGHRNCIRSYFNGDGIGETGRLFLAFSIYYSYSPLWIFPQEWHLLSREISKNLPLCFTAN